MATGGGSGGVVCSPLRPFHPLRFACRGAAVRPSSTASPSSHRRRRRHHYLRFSGGSKTTPCPPLLPFQRELRRFGSSREKGGGLGVCCGGVSLVNQSRFKEEVLDSDVPVLVDFVADWCGPCRLISPIVDWVSEEYKDQLKVVKIDHDASPQLIERYKVYGLPTLIIFKNGEEVPESRREGAVSKVKLKQFLDTFLEEKAVS